MRPALIVRAASCAALLCLVRPAGLPAAPADFGSRAVSEVLVVLGEAPPAHLQKLTNAQAQAVRGRDLFTKGRTTDAGGDSTAVQSKFFRCVNCHLTEREDPALSTGNAEARLAWLEGKQLPLLPGTTLYGAVNKTGWYENYERKYGAELVRKAQKDLRASIQLCSEHCSQGRTLAAWEVEAVLAYLWTIQYRMNDLGLTADQLRTIEAAVTAGRADPALVRLIRGRFLSRTPTTFARAEDFKPGPGDPARGVVVFRRACQSCHNPAGPSVLDMTTKNGRGTLNADIPDGEAIENIREGHAPPKDRQGRYMPEYSLERLSDGQIRDLFAHVGAAVAGDKAEAAAAPPVAGAGATADPAAAARGVFQTRCVDCHGRKAGVDYMKFNYIENLDKLAANRKFIVPGSPDKSNLYLYVARSKKPYMPAKREPLTAVELEAVRAWIASLPASRP